MSDRVCAQLDAVRLDYPLCQVLLLQSHTSSRPVQTIGLVRRQELIGRSAADEAGTERPHGREGRFRHGRVAEPAPGRQSRRRSPC